MNIKIRTAKPSEKNKLREFYIKAYPEDWKYKVDEYWEWLYIKAPNIKNENTIKTSPNIPVVSFTFNCS